MQITYQERIGPDGKPMAVPIIPLDATAGEIEAVLLQTLAIPRCADAVDVQMEPSRS